jgi:hypothetical protein
MLSKKSSGYVLVLSVGIAAVLLSLRWFEARVGTGGFFSGIVVGVVLSLGACSPLSLPLSGRSRLFAENESA